jgi:hypothetical protein
VSSDWVQPDNDKDGEKNRRRTDTREPVQELTRSARRSRIRHSMTVIRVMGAGSAFGLPAIGARNRYHGSSHSPGNERQYPMTLSPFLTALGSEGPPAARAEDMDLYGWLIGSWEMDSFRHLADGTVQKWSGECHFGWVLEGRAIQDV